MLILPHKTNQSLKIITKSGPKSGEPAWLFAIKLILTAKMLNNISVSITYIHSSLWKIYGFFWFSFCVNS